MPETGAINYVEFPTTDMTATKAFYTKAFGWGFIDYGPDYASFTGAGVDGGFTKVDTIPEGGPLVVLYAKDLEAMEAKVRDAGATITRDIFSFPGGRRFEFKDPQGNALAVWSE